MPKRTKTRKIQKGWCNKPTKRQLQGSLNTENLMLPKRHESTEADRRTWPHVPSETPWSTSSDTHQEVEIQRETSTKMRTPL